MCNFYADTQSDDTDRPASGNEKVSCNAFTNQRWFLSKTNLYSPTIPIG